MEKFNFNNMCHFGAGSLTHLSNEITKRNVKSVFILTDNNLINNGIYDKILVEIMKCKIFSTVFADISSEPKVNEIKNAFAAFKKSKADLVVAVGGGSVIDSAKAISIIATNPEFEDVISLNGKKQSLKSPISIIAIPTTAGSGAEISSSLVFSDEVRNKKIICSADNILPVVTIFDASLLTTMPDITTLSSGFDALCHAIESLISKNANVLSKALANDAIEIISKNLPLCYDEPNNLSARESMAYASYMAALAYSNSGLGICHSLAHAVQEKINIPHGIALAILMPAVLKFNIYSNKTKEHSQIAQGFGLYTNGNSQDEICRAAIKEFEKFRNDFNIPKKLSDYGLKESQLDIIALNAFDDVCTQTNPRICNTTDLYMILKKLI